MEKPKVFKVCSIISCKSSSKDQISLFAWPKDLNTREKWNNFMRKHDDRDIEKYRTLRLCEKHFFSEDIIIYPYAAKRLKPGSFPKDTEPEVKLNFNNVKNNFFNISSMKR